MSRNEDMIPTKDTNGYHGLEIDLTTDTDAALVQQRTLVAKLGRDELEDRYLRLLEENTVLKKHACKQEDKIKKLATKLIRVISDKKRMEVASGGPGKLRDIETEELIEDQQQRIRELEQQNTGLKERLLVAKNQLVGTNRQQNRRSPARRPLPPRAPSQQSFAPSPTPVPAPQHPSNSGPGQLLNQQAMRLLEDARNENRMLEDAVTTLKEQVNIYEQEVDQIKEQSRIKESNYEEEISILKTQVSHGHQQTVTENIEIIRLQRENKIRGAENQSLKAQVQGLDENLHKVKVQDETSKREADDLLRQLQEEQRKSSSLTQEISSSSSSRQSLFQAQEKIKDIQKDNSILRESNEKLLNSAFDMERERSYQATENALKVQISQLETTLKSDLNDKKRLTDALAKEREAFAQLDSDFQDLQSKFFAIKEDVENQEDKMQYFARENSVDMKELEDALIYLKQKVDPPSPKKELPSFLDQLDTDDQDLKTELSELQVQHIEAINELEKTRNLLRVQININNEQKKEISILQKRLGTTKQEYQEQVKEYQKLLEMRANKIQKLENQLRESAFGNLQKSWNKSHLETGRIAGNGTTVHTASGQSLFEVHVQKITLTQEALISLGMPEPKIFVSWLFYDSDQSYTPVMPGPVAAFDSSSYYKVKLDESFLEFLFENEVMLQVHVAINNDCQTIAAANIKFTEILDYPQNKLHGSAILNGVKGSSKDCIMGSLDYWFKLHTHDTRKIRKYVDKREQLEQIANAPPKIEHNINFLQGERNKFVKHPKIDEESTPDECESPPQPAPRVKEKIEATQKKIHKPIKINDSSEDSQTQSNISKPINVMEDTESGKIPKADETPSESSETSLPKRLNTTLSKTTASKLDKIIMNRGKSQVKEKYKKPVKKEDTEEKNEVKINQADDIVKPSGSHLKKRSILKSLSGKHVKSEESAILTEEKEREVNADKEETKVEKPTPQPRNPVPVKDKKTEREKQGSTKETEVSESKQSEETKEQKQKPKMDNIEDSEESSEDEEESEEESEEDSEEDSDESDADESDESDYDVTTATEATTRADTSVTTTTSEVKPSKIKVTPDVHKVNETATDSHDSEGVITKKSPTIKKNSFSSKDNIIIVVSDFEAAKDAVFIKDDKVSQLYVEYKFLDLPPEELETPFSLPKPSSLDKITFNFRKVIKVDRTDNSPRRRLVSKMLRSEEDHSRLLRFLVVSEPPDSEPDLDCEDIGIASLDLGIISRSGKDLVDQ